LIVHAGRKNECKITSVYSYIICASVSKIGQWPLGINEATQKMDRYKIKAKAYSAKHTFTRN